MNSTEAARTAEAFQKNYKENMADWIKSDLSGDDELRAVALLQGNIEENGFEEKGKAREGFDAGARAEQVYNAVTGFGTDEEGLFDAISNLNKDEIELLTAEYQKKYQTDLTSRIRGELSGIDLEIANTYLSGEVNEQGNNTKAIALRLARAMESWGTIDSEISHSLTMQPLTQIEKGEVELAYKWKTGRSLNEAFEGDLGKGQLQQARSLLADSDVGTDTGRAKEVIDTYWNGRKDQLIEIFAGKTPEHNQKVIENFENQFGENFYDAAKKGSWAGLSEKDLSILRKVVETGEAPAGLR
jgi:hypothetical protein